MNNNVEKRVSQAIKASNMPQKDIAKGVGVNRNTIRRWEAEKTKTFTNEKLRALAKTLRMNYEWLRFGKGEMYDDSDLPPDPKINGAIDALAEMFDDGEDVDQFLSDLESKIETLLEEVRDLKKEYSSYRKIFDVLKKNYSDDSG